MVLNSAVNALETWKIAVGKSVWLAVREVLYGRDVEVGKEEEELHGPSSWV